MKKAVEEKNHQFTKAHITGDSAFLVNIFTQDAKVFAPNSDVGLDVLPLQRGIHNG